MSARGSQGVSREQSVNAALISGAVDTLVTLSAFLASRSSVILADFLKTVLEFAAVALALYTVRRVRRGADEQYHYGVGKMEHLSSLCIGALMVACLAVIAFSAIRNLLHPSHISGVGVWISMATQTVYGVVNGILFWKTRRLAAAESSPLMASQARLLLSRAVANVFILGALALSLALHSHRWSLYIDPLASLVIATFILLSAIGIFSSSTNDLLDRALEEESQLVIMRELVRFFDDYEQVHGVRTRRSGSQVFIELFMEFAPNKTVGEVQGVIDRLTACLEQAIPGSQVSIALTTRRIN